MFVNKFKYEKLDPLIPLFSLLYHSEGGVD
jgi:hypothetical protein